MKKMRKLRNVVTAIALVFAMVIFSAPEVYAETDSNIIKVGIIRLDGYAVENDDGTITGYNAEFAYNIAQHANLKIQIVLFDSGMEGLASLENGSIDMMCNALKTAEREEKYLFAENEVSTLSMSLFVRKEDDRYSYNNVEQIASMTIGAEEGSKVQDYFVNWCSQHGITPNLKQYESLEAIKNAVNAKEIDAGIYGSPSVDGYKTLCTFAPQPYYFIFRKSNTALKNKVDNAMASILAEDPLYRTKLMNKYASQIATEMEALTSEERSYIQSRSQIVVAVLQNDQPYYAKDKDGNDSGIVADLYQKIAVMTGLSFKFQSYSSEEEAVEAVKSGEADVLGMYSDGLISAYNKGLRVTAAYADVDAVLVTHSGVTTSNIKKIACKKRTITAIQNGIGANLNAEFVGYNSGSECFEALKKGEVDAMICGQPSANWLINQSNVSAYSITTLASNTLEISGALAYSSSVLCSVLSKAINATSYSFNELVTNNTLPSNDLKAAVTRMSPVVMLSISGALIAMVIILIWAMSVLMKHQKEKNALMQMKAETEKRQMEVEAAEKQTEEKNQFFSNISHDMRTPLNAIIGFSEIASMEAETPKTKEYLAKIKSSGQLLNDLINDTLTISKVNSGKMVLQPRQTETKDIFNAVYFPIKEMAEKKGVSFTYDISQCRSRSIFVDPLSLEKILMNLLTNAVKYTPAGGHVKFTAKMVNDAQGKPESVFIVEDDGIGISEDFLPRIYEPFLQEDNSGGESSGTGLGLSIVKNLMDIMGGVIEVESQKGEGTKFTLHFHFENVIEDQEIKIEEAPAASLAGKRILLCEDNKLNRELATALLQKKGMIIDSAANGREGLEKYQQSKENYYDAVLMDVRMPVMTGLEATKAIRASRRHDAQDIPVIAMTANAFEDDVKECLAAGMNAHIAKPIEPEVMFRTIAENLRKQNA